MLSQSLVREGYRFVTITPASHERILNRRAGERAASLADVFGWGLPFAEGIVPPQLIECLRTAGMLDTAAGLHRSKVRVSTVNDSAYVHSSFPTQAENAVFLGPDSYRFANLITDELARQPLSATARIVDIGVGAGVGALTAASCCPAATIVATDINSEALRLAGINAAAAGVAIETVETSGLDGVPGTFDLLLLNPPYLMDSHQRAYRDGGMMHGAQLPFDLTLAALGKLSPGGRLILYSGSAIVAGRDALREKLRGAAADHGCEMCYREIDPDVFGEELDNPAYADVDRIALISAVFTHRP